MARKNPVLLRRAPLSGRINVLTNYRREKDRGRITVVGDGKHDVTAAYYALMLEELLDEQAYAEHEAARRASPDLIAILDGVADGDPITEEQRGQVRAFRERLREITEAHNGRIESGELEAA